MITMKAIMVVSLLFIIITLVMPMVLGKEDHYDIININAKFSEPYTSNVSADQEIIYNYHDDIVNKSSVRLHISAINATTKYPVFVVIRQQETMISWEMPLTIHDTYKYYNVTRTLCHQPDENPLNSNMSVDISTASPTAVNFTLWTSFYDFTISIDETVTKTVTPAEPQYLLFKFPDDVDTVLVKASSEDDLCMVLSVQTIHCPVFDLDMNVQFTGSFQTMTKKAGMTLQKDNFPGNGFYIVFVLKPNDLECTGVQNLKAASDIGGYQARNKTVTVQVIKTISGVEYVKGILGAVFFFLTFYLIAGLTAVFYYFCVSRREGDHIEVGETDSSNVNQGASTSYGTVSSVSHRPDKELQKVASDDSSVDEDDIDRLEDVDLEKDVYRTKMHLMVSDLAKKKVKVLLKKYKLYHKNLFTISIFYGLPVVQLVITYQKVLHITGNEDICYYNFFCAHPLGVLSAFNNVFSNCGYFLLGFLFLLITLRRDRIYKKAMEKNDVFVQTCGIPQHYGLYYAMGLALMVEGIMSACYHVCPTYSNFQFDTAFMYVIAFLCMLKIYAIRHPDINATSNSTYFSLAFVILFAVFGVVYSSVYFWILFTLVHVICLWSLTAEIYYVGRWKLNTTIFKRIWVVCKTDVRHCAGPTHKMRFTLLLIGNMINWAIALYGVITQPKDFASYLLGIFIVNLLLYMIFYIAMKKFYSKETIKLLPLLFIGLSTITWTFALYFFVFKALTNWEEMPARSRESNEDCILLNFYDNHDVWHFLSALGLFFSFMVLMFLDDDLVKTPRNKIPVF